jgi:cobalamin synthase
VKRNSRRERKMMGDRITGLFGLLFALYVLMGSLRLDVGGLHQPGPGFFSFFGGILLAVFSAILLVRSMLTKGEDGGKKKKGEEENPKAVIFVVIALVIYGMVLEFLGFVLCTFFLVILLMCLFDRKKWWVVLFTAACISFGSYVVFNMLLKSDMPVGILEGIL